MKVGLWIGLSGSHTLRFDEADINDIASVMRAVSYRQPVQVSDHNRNILGTWRAGELRDAATELSRLTRGRLT